MMRVATVTASIAFAIAAVGCGDAHPAAATPELTAEARPVEAVPIEVEGHIDNREPVGQLLPVAYTPLARVHPEGQPIAVGDELASLNPGLALMWLGPITRELRTLDETLGRDALKAQSQLADLAATRRQLEATRDEYLAEIAATRVGDDAQLAIARLEADEAERVLARAQARVAHVTALSAAGRASGLALREARDARDLAAAAVALPRLRLELLATNTRSVARRRLQLELAAVTAELGDATHDGIAADIDALAEVQRQTALADQLHLRRLQHQRDVRQAIVEHPTIAANASGLVRYAGPYVRPGAKLPLGFIAYVLDGHDLVVRFELPERFRGLVEAWTQARERVGRATLAIDAVGASAIPARVLSIASVPAIDAGRTGRSFACTIRLDQQPDGLRPGMHVRCALLVPVPTDAVTVPTWCVADQRRPGATLADGTSRMLTGFAVDQQFIAVSGLSAGERVRAAQGHAGVKALRLTGLVTAAQEQAIKLSERYWQLQSVVPDGTLVEKGEIVARLSKVWGWDPAMEAADYANALVTARARFAAARIAAGRDRAQALVKWHKAEITAETARLERYVARFSSFDEEEATGEATLTTAVVATAKARAAADEMRDPDIGDSLSVTERAARTLTLARAELAERAARLGRCAALRARDWLAVATAEEAERAADEAAVDARATYSEARAAFEQALTQATVAVRSALQNPDLRHARAASIDEEVRAPVAGRLYRTAQHDGKPVEIGSAIESLEPFAIPVGGGRRFTIEVPLQLCGRFVVGQQVAFVIPTLGAEPRSGRVVAIAPYVADATASIAEVTMRGTIGVPDKVVLVTVGFEVTADEEALAPPGTTAYVDL